MKKLLALLAASPALALSHGNHEDTHSDVLHGVLHAAMSLEGLAVIAALGAVVYLVCVKK